MIFLPRLLSISNAVVHFLRLVKSLIFSPICIKASLRVSEDWGGVLACRMDSVESYVVLVALIRFSPFSSTVVLVRRTILRIIISLLTVLIWWRGRTVRNLMVSYASALMMRFINSIQLPFYLRMTIESVVLTYSISIGAILTFAIYPISPAFSKFDCWVLAGQSWWLVPMSSGYRSSKCVSLKKFWVIVMDDSSKASRISTRTEFMWDVINLRVPWCLIQFILVLPYKLLVPRTFFHQTSYHVTPIKFIRSVERPWHKTRHISPLHLGKDEAAQQIQRRSISHPRIIPNWFQISRVPRILTEV